MPNWQVKLRRKILFRWRYKKFMIQCTMIMRIIYLSIGKQLKFRLIMVIFSLEYLVITDSLFCLYMDQGLRIHQCIGIILLISFFNNAINIFMWQ